LDETCEGISLWGESEFCLFVQDFSNLPTYYPYIHEQVVEGAFSEPGTFRVSPPITETLLVEQLYDAVLNYLVEAEVIAEDFALIQLMTGICEGWLGIDCLYPICQVRTEHILMSAWLCLDFYTLELWPKRNGFDYP